MRMVRFTKKDIVLVAVAALIGGPATAQAILSLANQYLKKYFRDQYPRDFELEYFRNVLSSLRRDGLVAKSSYRFWKITKRGSGQAASLSKYQAYQKFKADNRTRRPNTIITFDVPELQRKKRDYLRLELAMMGYVPIQKSVWIGHSPLPKEFFCYVRELQLARHLHIFTIKDYGTLV